MVRRDIGKIKCLKRGKESLTTRPIGPRIPGWPIRPGTPCLREKETYVCKYNKNIKCEKFFLLKITFYIRLEFMKYLCSVSFRDAPSQKESCNLRFVQIFPGHRVHPRPRVHPKINKWRIESSTSEHYDDINLAKTKKTYNFSICSFDSRFSHWSLQCNVQNERTLWRNWFWKFCIWAVFKKCAATLIRN